MNDQFNTFHEYMRILNKDSLKFVAGFDKNSSKITTNVF